MSSSLDAYYEADKKLRDLFGEFCRSIGGRSSWRECVIPRKLNRRIVREIGEFVEEIEKEAEPFRDILVRPTFTFFLDDGRIVHELADKEYHSSTLIQKKLPEEIVRSILSFPGSRWTWMSGLG